MKNNSISFNNKILISGNVLFSKKQIKELLSLGCEIIVSLDESNIDDRGFGCEMVICNNLFSYYKRDNFPYLKFIQFTSVGLDRVPKDILEANDLIIKNISGCFDIPISEFVIMQLLNVLKNYDFIASNNNARQWIKNREAKEMNGLNVGIYGCGHIGIAIAKKLKAFSCSIIGFDANASKIQNDDIDYIYSIDSFQNYANKLDVLIISCPLTKDNKHVFNYSLMSKLKEETILVNVARGALIDTRDLILLLKERKNMFAILDVFEEEPLPKNHELWSLPNVRISPHSSFCSINNNDRMFEIAKKNISCYLNNRIRG